MEKCDVREDDDGDEFYNVAEYIKTVESLAGMWWNVNI